MRTIQWILDNFGSLILFYAVNHFWGLKPAIAVSLAFAIGSMIRHKIQKRRVTFFMIFSFSLVLLFGAIDLYLKDSVLFKFEAGIMNLSIAGYFIFSLFREKSLIEELAEQRGPLPMPDSPDKTFYFQFLTVIWAFYYAAKAVIYTWIALTNSLEDAFAIRIIFGTGSFYALLGASIFLGRYIWRFLLWLKWMPSTRSVLN